ncbi:hypothetical protein ABT063_24735 [Streptomyces sp. NPDC002838]|uniref:hypothetical protein n=1 Tax=Streptomyces sp. NPDC002838 TaxID=3154436 RepID=UPI0033319B6E
MAFRRSVPQEDLAETMTPEQVARHTTTYQASRGGHFPAEERPVPGTPQERPRQN